MSEIWEQRALKEFKMEDYYAAYETFSGALFRRAQESLEGTQKLLIDVLKLFLSKNLIHEANLIINNFLGIIKRLRLPMEVWYTVILAAAEVISEHSMASSLSLKCLREAVSGLNDKTAIEPRKKAINLSQKLASTAKDTGTSTEYLLLAITFQLELNNISEAEMNLKNLFNTLSPQRDGVEGLRIASYLALFRLLDKEVDSSFEVLRTYRKQLPPEERKEGGKSPYFELTIECIQAFRSNDGKQLAIVQSQAVRLKDNLLSELLVKLSEILPPPKDFSNLMGF
ncbi:MAG: hypothetical protein ACFFBD_02180 [Candidatus Hodarchaeota archaeon]